MFGSLTKKFQDLFSSLSKEKKLTEESLTKGAEEVRLALLDADVNYKVASRFVKRVKEKAIGVELIESVSASEQFSKIVHDELVELMGGKEAKLSFGSEPSVILMCGLQGSGKTTTCGKLAALLKKKGYGRRPMLAACDLQRPAAIKQLQTLGEKIGVPVFTLEGAKDPVKVAKSALRAAKEQGCDTLIVDTAGRLHVDEELMKELVSVKKVLAPSETLFVASATTGQDAVKTATEFDARLDISGSVLTMLDGSSRAGAALSIKEVTQKPLKFEGVGEKMDDLRPFTPRSMADRILGMGDVINLVRKAEEHMGQEKEEDLEKKLKKGSISYNDFLKQMGMIKKMGSMKGILKMLPGAGDLGNMDTSDAEFKKIEAMILSMTMDERLEKVELDQMRRVRIARGSGVTLDDVNSMVKKFKQVKQLMKKMSGMGGGGFMKGMAKNMLFGKGLSF